MMTTILNQLPLVRLRFDLETLADSDVPPYKGDMLRMALLWWLSEFWCPEPTRCRHGCRRPAVCMFGRLCSPPVDPAWSAKIRYLVGATPPPAYALWDLRDRRTHFAPGAHWGFELTLIGELALRQIPAIVAAVQQGAEQGLGRIRLRNRVLQVLALTPDLDDAAAPRILAARDGQPELTWRSYRLEEIMLDYAVLRDHWPPETNPTSLVLRFLSPVKIKERGAWVEEPRFAALFKALVRRLRILSEVHGGGEWPHADYGPLLDIAEGLALTHHETHWTGYERRSRRSGRYNVEGFVGEAWYAGADLPRLLPVLWLGQWLHLGKGYVSGNGRYAVQLIA
ncbi:MAG: CRISPR system precrRNA processing endoribonuclease RAMP protein Cas6 [Chloroflexota bacterium]|nr:CRISPR system precrRNA processing endoribonuclease RAMP protein Cas6 [Chloroflexota bacterium]